MPKKKSKKKKEKKYTYLALFGIVILLYLILKVSGAAARDDGYDHTKCPYNTQGNNNSDFIIKYIGSPTCFWCMIEEPILDDLIEEKGNSFKLESYDIRYCNDLIKKYNIVGTPSFLFGIKGNSEEIPHIGFISKKNFNNIICEATGDC